MIKIKTNIATTLHSKTLGLMFHDKIEPLFFQTRFGIHTFFVKHPLIILVLDDKFKVTQTKLLSPNKIFFWNPKHKNILELPANKKYKNIKIGELIKIQ